MRASFAIAAGHEVTAEAGAEVLRAGGTAVDAAIAAGFAAMVAEPVLAGLLGGGFMMIRLPDGGAELLDFFVQTPRQKRSEGELDFRVIEADFGETTQAFHIGAGAIAASGLATGLAEAHARHGRMAFGELTVPARRAARDGVRVSAFQAGLGRIVAPILMASPAARALMCAGDAPLGEGALYRNPDFADLLEVFGHEGARFIQEGEVAGALLALTAEGGHLTRADLADYRPKWRAPLIRERAGVRLALNPPPSLGGTLIAFSLALIDRGAGPATIARAFEATGRARIEAAIDAAPGEAEAGAALAALLDPDLARRYRDRLRGAKAATRGTTQISVMDGSGLGVAMTLSNGEGCGEILPGTGIMPNNMLGEEDLVPRGWHSWQPGRRLASMMCPLMASWPDGRAVLMGSGGSNRIRTALAQVLLGLIDGGLGLEEAVTRPRLHVEGSASAAVDFEEPDLPEAARAALLDAYPEARGWARRSMFYGGVHGVASEGPGRAIHAAGDPRRAGVAILG